MWLNCANTDGILPLAADTWRLVGGWNVLKLDDSHQEFCQPQSSMRLEVMHPIKGDIMSKTMAALVEKALKFAEVSVALIVCSSAYSTYFSSQA